MTEYQTIQSMSLLVRNRRYYVLKFVSQFKWLLVMISVWKLTICVHRIKLILHH